MVFPEGPRQAGEGPQRKRAPETAGLGARQGAHRTTDGLIMSAGTPRAWRIAQAGQPVPGEARDPRPHP